MDYGIIFIIIIIIVIVIAIILLIYANRGNTQNLLLTLPNYRIQQLSTSNTNSYLSLTNLPNINILAPPYPIYDLNHLEPPGPNFNPCTSDPAYLPFWSVLIAGGASNNDPMGLWKINTLKQISVNVAEIQLINDVYFSESPNLSLGLVISTGTSSLGSLNNTFNPKGNSGNYSTFIMTTIATNTFTLSLVRDGFPSLPIVIDPATNLFVFRGNASIKPDVFKLQLI